MESQPKSHITQHSSPSNWPKYKPVICILLCWWVAGGGRQSFWGLGAYGLSTNLALSSLSALAFPTRIVSCSVCFFHNGLRFSQQRGEAQKKKNWLAYQRYRYQSTLFSRKLSRTFPWLFHLPAIPRLLNQLAAFSLALFAGTKSNFISTRVSFERAFSFTLFVTHSIDSLRCKDENSDNAERSLIIRLRFGPTENGKSGKTRSLGDGERWV